MASPSGPKRGEGGDETSIYASSYPSPCLRQTEPSEKSQTEADDVSQNNMNEASLSSSLGTGLGQDHTGTEGEHTEVSAN